MDSSLRARVRWPKLIPVGAGTLQGWRTLLMNCLLLGFEDKIPFLLQQDFSRYTVIDPTGLVAEAFANTVDHESVVYFSHDTPVGLNLLDYPPQEIVKLFSVLFPNGLTTLTRLYANLLFVNALSIVPTKDTILGVLKILSDMSFREKCIKACKDPVVLAGWTFINGWSEAQSAGASALLFSMIQTLLLEPTTRVVLCQETTFNGEQVFLADLSQFDELSAKLFGYLLSKRSGDVVLIDLPYFGFEPPKHAVVTVDFLTQLPPALKQRVMSFPKVAFRLSKEDAEELQSYFGVGNAAILTDLDATEIYTLQGKATLAPVTLPSRLKQVKQITKATSRKASEVNAAIAKSLHSPHSL